MRKSYKYDSPTTRIIIGDKTVKAANNRKLLTWYEYKIEGKEWINNENDFILLGYVLNKPNGVPFRTEHEEGYIYFVKIKEIDFQYELHKIYGKVKKNAF